MHLFYKHDLILYRQHQTKLHISCIVYRKPLPVHIYDNGFDETGSLNQILISSIKFAFSHN